MATKIEVAKQAEQHKKKIFRYGLFAKGVIYCLTGGLALATAVGLASSGSGKKDILNFIKVQPLGSVLLIILALGLLSFCIWQWYRAIQDPDDEGEDTLAFIKRIAFAVGGSFYGLLGLYTIYIVVMNARQSGSGNTRESALSKLLALPFGQILVGVVAVVFLIVCLVQLYKSIAGSYTENLKFHGLNESKVKWYRRFGAIGFGARAVVFGIISYFLFKTAMASDASRSRGTEGALEFLQQSSYGNILLVAVSLGLIFYGLFQLITAKHREF